MNCGLDYSKAGGLLKKRRDGGSNFKNDRGSYAMLPAESVSSNLSHRIDDERCRIDREGRGRRISAKRGDTMAETSELAGVVGSRPMGYGFTRE